MVAGQKHWKLVPNTNPDPGIIVLDNYPATVDQREEPDRTALAVTSPAGTSQNDGRTRIVRFHLEHIKPKPEFHTIPLNNPTGNENVERSFSAGFFDEGETKCLASHELGHAMSLDHTWDVNAQASTMCLGRDVDGGAMFVYTVNGTIGPSVRDGLRVLERYPNPLP